MKTYREIRQEMTGEREPVGEALPCSSCKAKTDVNTLSNFGGWCVACFEHYCDAAFDGKRTANTSPAAGRAALRELAQRLRSVG